MKNTALKQRILTFQFKYNYGAKDWRTELFVQARMADIEEQVNSALLPYIFDVVRPETLNGIRRAVDSCPIVLEVRTRQPDFMKNIDVNSGQFIL